ncbi:IS30 family transposase [Rummeliibacillus suwonensis]|nr:IS30 family transposase [Rummeliibacillus suwonensis]
MMQTKRNIKETQTKPRLTEIQRGKLEVYLDEGNLSKAEIARKLGVCRATIYNEIKRGTATQVKKVNGQRIYTTKYFAATGQAITERNVARSRNPLKVNRVLDFLEYADRLMKENEWSPDAVVGRALFEDKFLREEMVCVKTLYAYIDLGLLKTRNSDLVSKTTRKTKTVHKARKNVKCLGESIEKRPQHVETRDEFGHFEIDSVVGRKDKEDDVLLTLIERKTRREFIFKMDGKDADSVNYAVETILESFGELAPKLFKSITADNGSEFSELAEKFQESMGIYFTHPYSSWERGTNENHNRMIRRWIPKGTAIEDYSRSYIQSVEHKMNHLPRRIHGFKTPHEMFEEEVKRLGDSA